MLTWTDSSAFELPKGILKNNGIHMSRRPIYCCRCRLGIGLRYCWSSITTLLLWLLPDNY